MVNTLIRDALRDKGISQKALAKLLDCSEPLVSQLIKGAVKPTYRRAVAVERHLGIPRQQLMDEANAQPSTDQAAA